LHGRTTRKYSQDDVNQAKAAKQEEMQAEISTRMNADLKDLKEDIKSCKAQMRSTICTFWPEFNETIQHEMRDTIQSIRSELNEMTASQEATETEPYPGMMQSTEEHQDTPRKTLQ
jgi:hypothetical protein